MPVRRLSISTSFDYDIPLERQLPMIAGADFTHVSLGANATHSGYLDSARRRRLRSLLEETGLLLDTIHGPRADLGDAGTLSLAIEAAAELGAPVVIAHGGPFDFPADELSARVASLQRCCNAVAPMLEQTGVVLALENVMPGPATDLVRSVLPELDPRWFGLCYDSAHDQIDGPRSFGLLAEWSSRLHAVHLSDRVRPFVDHVPPGDGFINWFALAQVLAASSFPGPLLFEVMVIHSNEHDPAQLLQQTHARGCWLHDLIHGNPKS